MTLGQLLRETRKDLDLRQAEMSLKMRITQGGYSKLENDKSPMRVETLSHLAAFLQTQMNPKRFDRFIEDVLFGVRFK